MRFGREASQMMRLRAWIGERGIAIAACLIASAVMTASIKQGTALVDSVNGYHLHPIMFLDSLLHAWNSGTYLGFDNGAGQLTLFPGAIAYALLAHWGVASDVAQKAYFFVEFLTIALCVTWFVEVAGSRLTVLRPISAVAPVVYLCNLYVAENIQGGSALLWPYAVLPIILGLLVLAIQRRRPIYYGLLIGIASFFMTGINGTLVAINVLACAAVMIFLIANDPAKLEALRAGFLTAIIGTLSAVAANAYWILPFAYHLKTAWLPGVFSESIALHSVAANAPDVLRLLGDPGFFGHDKVNGWYFPFAPQLQGATVFAIASRLVPLLAFAVLLYKRGWGEPFLRFIAAVAILTVPLASGAHGGSDGGAWTAAPFNYLSVHVLVFQAFRGLEKWDSVLALAYAVLCAYHATLAFEALNRRGVRQAWLAPAFITAVALLAVYPLVATGAFRSTDLLHSIPDYWAQASSKLQFSPNERVAMFPEQYLPQFFWGNVGGDYANLALGHPATYSTARGSGAPSEDAAFALEAMYSTVYSGNGDALPLLRRLAVSDVVEQRDAEYAPSDTLSSPPAQLETLRSMGGIRESTTVGDLTDFRVSHALPMLQLSRPFFIPFRGSALLQLFRLLRPDEAAVTASDYSAVRDLPVVQKPDDLDLTAGSATPALAFGHVLGNSMRFRLSADENVRILVRLSLFQGPTRPDELLLDGIPVAMGSVGTDWHTVAVTRLMEGTHDISPSGPATASYDVKVVDDNRFHQVTTDVDANARGAYFLSLDGRRTLNVRASGTYTIRALSASQTEANYAFPLRFSNYFAGNAACVPIPFSLTGAVMLSDVAPPPTWYFDPALLPYTQDGMVPLALFGGSAAVKLYNPFSANAQLHIRGALAPLGASRMISLEAPNGIGVNRRYILRLPANLQLPNLSRGVLPPSNYLALTSTVAQVNYPLTAPHGWSTAVLQSSNEDGLPRADDPLGGLITFAALQGLEGYGCGNSARLDRSSGVETSALSLLSTDANPDPSVVATIRIPGVDLSSIPVLSVHVSKSGNLNLTAILHYNDGRGKDAATTLPFTMQSDSASVVLVPDALNVSRNARITAVDIVASLQSGNDAVVSEPRLTLSRANVVRIGTASIRGDVNRGEAVLSVPSIVAPQRKSVVLQIRNPNTNERDVYLDSSQSGYYVGRAEKLEVLSTERISDLYAQVTMKAPPGLSYSVQDGWRRHIRLFANGKELQPARSSQPLPGQFLLAGTNIDAIVPISSVAELHDWQAVFVPTEWTAVSPFAADTEELRIPAADGLTTLDGSLRPLSGVLNIHAVTRSNTVNVDAAPLSIDAAFIEDVGGNGSDHAPALMLDGRPVSMSKSQYGWYEARVPLAQGNHVFADTNKEPITALILPQSIASAASPAVQNASWSDTVSAEVEPGGKSTAAAVVLRQMYSPGWAATARGHLLRHFVADGYANGFIVPPDSGVVHIFYQPERLLWTSRWASGIALILCSLGATALALVEMLPRRKTEYVSA